MGSRTRNTDRKVNNHNRGALMIMAILALAIMTVLGLHIRSLWQRDHIRELERELLFRGRQYALAIEDYLKKNNNLFPESLEVLYDKKHIRQLFRDPLSESGEWNLVMRPNTPEQKKLQVIRPIQLKQYLSSARLVGVVSSSSGEAMLEYREKKRYSEWAFTAGDDPQKSLPDLEFMFEQ